MRIITIIIIALSLIGCSSQTKREAQKELLRPVDRQAEVRKLQQAQALYDDKGRLLASSQVVAGLRLPRGLVPRLISEHRWTYQTEVPLEKIHWYLSSRVQTTQVTQVSGATTYVAARPREVSREDSRLDITVSADYPNTNLNIIQISERQPLPADGKSPMARFLEGVQEQKRNAY